VVSSDRKASTVVSLVDPATGMLTRDQCLHTGSAAPGLSVALSGDVALPSRPLAGNPLVVIDRKNSTLTWVDPTTCAPVRQMNVGQGFAANPQDVVGPTPAKAYVTRYEANPANAAEGSDILVIDPQVGQVLGRIDLRPHVGAPAGTDKPLLPRPTRALSIGGKIYVALNVLSEDYKAAGPGRVAIVDPGSDQVSGVIELPGLKNCGALDDVPAQSALVVACGGVFSDGPQQIDGSGVAWVDLSGAQPRVATVVPAARFGRPVSGFEVAALSDTTAFTLTFGDFGGPAKDALWAFDFKDGMPRKVFEAQAEFTLAMMLDRGQKRLYALEASKEAPKVHVFDAGDPAGPTKRGELSANPGAGLPPRQMSLY
jgi:hypothetical protein